MRRLAMAAVLVCFGAGIAPAQVMPGGQAKELPNTPKRPQLAGERKARYLAEQLYLSTAQEKTVEGIVETVYSQAAGETIDINKVQSLMQEIRIAQDKGDKATEQRLTEELREMGRGGNNDKEFLENLRKVINPEQTKLLDEAIERLEINPSGWLRPVDVVRVCRKMKLDEKEQDALKAAEDRYRDRQNNSVGQVPDAPRPQLIDEMVNTVREGLSAEKREKFDDAIRRLKSYGAPKTAPTISPAPAGGAAPGGSATTGGGAAKP